MQPRPLDHRDLLIPTNKCLSVLRLNCRIVLACLMLLAIISPGFSQTSSAPSPPTNLTATAGDGSVSLSWTAAAGSDYCQVFRSTTSGGPYSQITNLYGSTTTYTDSNLANGTYYYVVQAQNNGGTSSYSNEASATLSTATPTNLTATAGDGSVSLSWTAAAGSDYCQVFRSTTSGGPYSQITNLYGSTTTYTDSNLANGTYYYVVQSQNNSGTSAFSPEAGVTLFINPPSNLQASVKNGTAIRLTWNASPKADYYEVFRSTASGGPYNSITHVHGYVLDFDDDGLALETRYFYT